MRPKSLVKLNARRVPVASVLMGAVAGFLGIIAATEAPQAVFDFLVSSSGALIVFVYMTIAVAQITCGCAANAPGNRRRR